MEDMESEKDKMNAEVKETHSSRLTCADCAVDIDKLLAEVEEDATPAEKSGRLVFDVSHLGAGTLNRASENVTRGTEQGQD
jgi:hypothetical protein